MNQHYSDPPPHTPSSCVCWGWMKAGETAAERLLIGWREGCWWQALEEVAVVKVKKSQSHKASTSMAGWRWWRWSWCDGGVGHMSGMCSMWLWVVTVLWTGVTAGSLGTGGVPSSTLSAPWVSSTAKALHQGPWRSCWGGRAVTGPGVRGQ